MIEKERATSGAKLKEEKLKLRSQMIHARNKNEVNIASVTSKCESIITKENLRRREPIKYHITKVDKERKKSEVVSEKSKLTLIQHITRKQNRCSTQIKLIQSKNIAKFPVM